MRIVMYVQNAATHDSRVLREAATLAAAGHRVTVMATPRTAEEPDGSREERDGFTVVRVGIPTGAARWPTFVRAPWQAAASTAGSAVHGLRAGPRLWRAALRDAAATVVTLPWLLVRGAWVAVVNRVLRRPVRMRWVEYLRRWQVETVGWCRAAAELAPPADVHHAHDLEALPAARTAARRDGSRYVYDSHEVFTGLERVLRLPRPLRWAFWLWERRLAGGAAALVTVNDEVAAVLRARLGTRRIVVVHNCPPEWNPPAVAEDRIRRATGLADGTPVILYHGVFLPGRGLEQAAAALREPGLEAAHLVFLGYPQAYLGPILADRSITGRVHYLPAVDPAEVPAWVAGADVDVMPILPSTLSRRLTTPNKLFESIAAGVPVVAADLPAMRRVVLDPAGPLGVLCEPTDPRSIAAALRRILELEAAERAAWRERILRAARARWNWETEVAGLVALYAELEPAGSPDSTSTSSA